MGTVSADYLAVMTAVELVVTMEYMMVTNLVDKWALN